MYCSTAGFIRCVWPPSLWLRSPFPFELLYVGLLAALTHLAVDLGKFFLSRRKKLAHAASLFLGD